MVDEFLFFLIITRSGKIILSVEIIFGFISFLSKPEKDIGFISVGLIVYEKINKISENVPLDLIRPVTDQPLFYIALVSIIIGVQLFLVGFLSELVIQINSDRKGYKIEKTGDVKKS